MRALRIWLLIIGLVGYLPVLLIAQPRADSLETKRFAIEVAGVRIGTMTAVRQPQEKRTVMYSLVSDVKVNFLIYKLKIYYKVTNLFQEGRLISSVVNAHTNQGDFSSRTEWTGTQYDIVANQYKYNRRATETRRIDYTITNLFFGEPTGKSQVYSEYFGDYFTVTSRSSHTYQAQLADREDEYEYANGELRKIIKKNSLKNFVIRPIP